MTCGAVIKKFFTVIRADDQQRVVPQSLRLQVVANEEFEKAFPAKQCTKVTITTKDGKKVSHGIDVPKGDPRDPMTPSEIRVKFDALAEPVMSESRRTALREAVFSLEELGDVDKLMTLTIEDK